MNILIPDSWLREFLKTNVTSKQLKEYVSLCGPDVARVDKLNHETIYDVEVTTNRPDSMSVLGVAREASAILPRFGVTAELINDPYTMDIQAMVKKYAKEGPKKLSIQTDAKLNPRWTSIVIDNVVVKPSPKWLQKNLELTGIRPLNNIIDITNYLMRAYGQPAHAFDYDEIKKGRNGIPTMILRAAKRGERVTTLDGKTHTLPGGDIVIEDGSGRLIDLAGIMGAENSSIKKTTKTIVLFMQTYDPVQIRKTSMSLAHRTEAAALFEKGLDPELVLPTVLKGTEMVEDLAGGTVASKLYDLYPAPFKPYQVETTRKKLDAYLGASLPDKEVEAILNPLGFEVKTTQEKVSVAVPSFRRDIEIDVDIIEEVARIYGYHNIKTKLPEGEPPVVYPDPVLTWEEEIKIRLRDWGYTETYTYSMISEEVMDQFNLDKSKAYKISNPLSNEWVYMRPMLTPSLLMAMKQNIHLSENLRLFELSMIYQFEPGGLPKEEPHLAVMWKGDTFLEAKGLAEALLELFGIPFPTYNESESKALRWFSNKVMKLGAYGAVGVMDQSFVSTFGIKEPITRLYLNIPVLIKNAQTTNKYQPIPKYPSVIEDMTFELPAKTAVGEVMATIKSVSPLVHEVSLKDQFNNAFTFRMYYLDAAKQISDTDVKMHRKKIETLVTKNFNAKIKSS